MRGETIYTPFPSLASCHKAAGSKWHIYTRNVTTIGRVSREPGESLCGKYKTRQGPHTIPWGIGVSIRPEDSYCPRCVELARKVAVDPPPPPPDEWGDD